MDDYKGLYYKETKEQKFYEGGAHFPYEELYEILVYIKEEQDKKQKEESKDLTKNKSTNKNKPGNIENSNNYIMDLIQNHKSTNENKTKTRTRNVGNNCLYNNPNTLIKKNVGKNNKNQTQQINIAISFNDKNEKLKSRNYKNDYALFYNRTTNQINREDRNALPDNDISGIKTRNNLSNYMQKKLMGKNNSTNQIKHKKLNLNNYLYSNMQKNFNRNNITEKNNKNDSYIVSNSKKLEIFNSNFGNSKTKNINNSNNYSKGRKINSSINKLNNININNYLNTNEHINRRQRNFSGINPQISHNINNYINVNINNNNNINFNINNVSYKNNYNNRNKNTSLNRILMTLNKSNNRKYSNKKDKDKEFNDKKSNEFIFDYIKINKSRNTNKKNGLGHVKSMDYNNKPLTIELVGLENNTFYDKTFCNNNNGKNKNPKINVNNNYKINVPKQINKFGMNYSYIKMKKDNIKKNNIVFKPVKKEQGILSNDVIKKYNIRNNNYMKINNNTTKKNEIITHKVNINKNNVINIGKISMINNKRNNNEIWSKYYGYFKKLNNK